MGRGGQSSGSSHSSGGGHFHYSNSGGRAGRGTAPVHHSAPPPPSYHRAPPPPPHHHPTYVEVHETSTVGTVMSCITLLIIVAVAFVMHFSGGGAGLTRSTHPREKLASSACKAIDTWYVDDVDWIHDEKKLVKGLKKFYDETGVQPLLYITDNIDGKAKPTESDFNNKLRSMYDEYFKDQGHVIVCFLESSSSDYATYYVAGAQAKEVIDDEGGEILLDYLDVNYTKDMSDEEFFATSFTQAANRMMHVSTQFRVVLAGVIGVVVIVGGVVVVAIMRKKRAEADAAILNSKIEEL